MYVPTKIFFRRLILAAQNPSDQLWQFLTWLWNQVSGWIYRLGGTIGDGIIRFVQSVIDLILAPFKAALSLFNSFTSGASSAFNKFLNIAPGWVWLILFGVIFVTVLLVIIKWATLGRGIF